MRWLHKTQSTPVGREPARNAIVVLLGLLLAFVLIAVSFAGEITEIQYYAPGTVVRSHGWPWTFAIRETRSSYRRDTYYFQNLPGWMDAGAWSTRGRVVLFSVGKLLANVCVVFTLLGTYGPDHKFCDTFTYNRIGQKRSTGNRYLAGVLDLSTSPSTFHS